MKALSSYVCLGAIVFQDMIPDSFPYIFENVSYSLSLLLHLLASFCSYLSFTYLQIPSPRNAKAHLIPSPFSDISLLLFPLTFLA